MLWVIIDRDCRYNFKYRHLRKDILSDYTDEEILDIISSMKDSCVLDVADKGKQTLEQIGKLIGLSSQRIQAMERGIGQSRGYIERMRQTATVLDSPKVDLPHRQPDGVVREVRKAVQGLLF